MELTLEMPTHCVLTRPFLLSGKATITVAIPKEFVSKNQTPDHYTYQIRVTGKRDAAYVWLLNGPDNINSYVYLAQLNMKSGEVSVTRKSAFPKGAWPVVIADRVLQRLFANEQHVIEERGWKVMHIGRCGRCSRPLTTPASLECGLGPECAEALGVPHGKTE